MGRGKEQLGRLPFLTTWLEGETFPTHQTKPDKPRWPTSHRERCLLQPALPEVSPSLSSSCPAGLAQESWGRWHGCWCHRRLCSHHSSLRCSLPTPPAPAPSTAPTTFHLPSCPATAGFVPGRASSGRLPEAEFGHGLPPAVAGSALLLTVPPGPNPEKAPTEDVWFPRG